MPFAMSCCALLVLVLMMPSSATAPGTTAPGPRRIVDNRPASPPPPPGQAFYTAAVGQTNGGAFHAFSNHSQAVPVMLANLARYDALAAEAKARGAQIIVFSEAGLGYGHDFQPAAAAFAEQVPHAGGSIDATRSPVLGRAAAIAQKHAIVLVLHMADEVPCAQVPRLPCPVWSAELSANGARAGFWYYGTQVARSWVLPGGG